MGFGQFPYYLTVKGHSAGGDTLYVAENVEMFFWDFGFKPEKQCRPGITRTSGQLRFRFRFDPYTVVSIH